MSHLLTDQFICLNCDKTFNHYFTLNEIIKCPFCGSTKVKIVEKETTIQKPDGEIETTKETTVSISSSRGIEVIIMIIFSSIGLYVVAFILPGALTAITTTTLTSVNPAINSTFTVLIPMITATVFILLLITVIKHSLE